MSLAPLPDSRRAGRTLYNQAKKSSFRLFLTHTVNNKTALIRLQHATEPH